MTDRRAFRTLVEAKEILVLPGVFNGYSVRLVERFGYNAAAISGAGLSESLLGFADRGILTFDQNLRACEQLAACTSMPLLADADTGYGNALNVHFVTRAFERAGLAAISVEDQESVEKHLSFCRTCCGELEFAKELRSFLASNEVEEIPPDVKAHLERFVQEL